MNRYNKILYLKMKIQHMQQCKSVGSFAILEKLGVLEG